MSVSSGSWALPLAAVLLVGTACALPGVRRSAEPFRLSQVVDHGDARRRASTRLVLDGLDADAVLRPAAALPLYERALQVDPTNPWAYLALARHRADGPTPRDGLPALDQADAMVRIRGEPTPGVEAHLVGLRGAIYFADGRREDARPLLRRARELSPSVWSDGRLSAEELR